MISVKGTWANRRWIAALALSAASAGIGPTASGNVVNPTLRIATTLGDIDLTLYAEATPLSVDNFLAYVDTNRLIDSFFHRKINNFVVQGGSFTWAAGSTRVAVPTFAPVQNEPGISNTRGTIAYAKLGGDPNSATSGFFFNLVNNNATSVNNLDAQNGGFTVFAKVVGNGMSVVDAIAALPNINAGSPYNNLPYLPPLVNNTIQRSNVVFIESITALGVLEGDFNGNGSIEQGDLDLVLNNWGQAGSRATVGLYGYGPGAVDQSALDAVLNNWGSVSAPNFQGSPVPEPAMLGLGGLAVVGLTRRRSRP